MSGKGWWKVTLEPFWSADVTGVKVLDVKSWNMRSSAILTNGVKQMSRMAPIYFKQKVREVGHWQPNARNVPLNSLVLLVCLDSSDVGQMERLQKKKKNCDSTQLRFNPTKQCNIIPSLSETNREERFRFHIYYQQFLIYIYLYSWLHGRVVLFHQ